MLAGVLGGLLTLLFLVRGEAVGAATCSSAGDIEIVVASIFTGGAPGCDLNGDGQVTAADLVASLLDLTRPTASPAPDRSPTDTPPPSPSPTPTSTPSATVRACPSAGAALAITIENRSGSSPLSVSVDGERTETDCAAGALSTAYQVTAECGGDEGRPCVEIARLAPGLWRHSIRVLSPASGQEQHQSSLLIAGATNTLRYTAFASVLVVRTTANGGNGSLRRHILAAESVTKPALIQFDPQIFPPGKPTTIRLEFALPPLSASDVTVDGIDPGGAAGNRIIDAGGLPIGAFAISGARNRIVGLQLRNAGANNRDVLSISGPAADANLVERTIIDGAASADGIGVDGNAGKDFIDSVNIIRDCEVRGAADKGVKVTTGSYARVESSWIHDNMNGGIQATLGGHIQAWRNLVENNRGGSAQNGLAANADGLDLSELETWGNVVRRNGANGVSIRGSSVGRLRDDYLAANTTSGLRVFNDIGSPASAVVEGVGAVCNAVDGAVVADLSSADFGGGSLGSLGNNAFTQNNLPAGGANLRNATGMQLHAVNNQWENCGNAATCNHGEIARLDLNEGGATVVLEPAQAHRVQQPVVTAVVPLRARAGELVRIFGSGFNAIDGHFSEDRCEDVAGRNRCAPLRGNCVRVGGVSAPVEAVTPRMLVVRWPFTCLEPATLSVTIDQGSTSARSNEVTVCAAGD